MASYAAHTQASAILRKEKKRHGNQRKTDSVMIKELTTTSVRNMKKLRLNDNEVKEVVRMQQMIDSYEGFICALHLMMLSKREINYPRFADTNLDKEMNKIWRWVKEHKEYKNENAKQ